MLILTAGVTLSGVAQAAATLTATVFGMELVGTTESYKTLAQSQIAAAAATLYTAPASTSVFIRSIVVVNTNAAASQTFQLFSAGTAQANAITPVLTIPAGGMAVYEDGLGWQMIDGNGQLLQRLGGMTTPLTAALTGAIAAQSSTTEVVCSPTLTIPANLVGAGTTFNMEWLFTAAAAATANTITWGLRVGGIAGSLLATATLATPATALSTTPGWGRAYITFKTAGASGTVTGGLTVVDPRGPRGTGGGERVPIVGQAANAVVDTTTAKDFVITCKAGTADASFLTQCISGYAGLVRA